MAMPTRYTSRGLCCQLRIPPGISAHPCITPGECRSLFPLTPLWMCWDQPGLALSPAGLTPTHCHGASVASEQFMSFNCCKHIPGSTRAAMGRRRSWEKRMGKRNHSISCYGWTSHPRNVAMAEWGCQYCPNSPGGSSTLGIPARSMSPCSQCHHHHCATVLGPMGLSHPIETAFGVPWRSCAGIRLGDVPSLPSAWPPGWTCTHVCGANEVCKGQGSGGRRWFCKCYFLAQCPVTLPDTCA